MIKRLSWLASLAVVGLVVAAVPASARGGGHGGGGGHWGGGWHGGGHWHGGWGYRGWGYRGYYPVYPYYWTDPYAGYCGTRLVRVVRGGYWVWRRVPVRCYY